MFNLTVHTFYYWEQFTFPANDLLDRQLPTEGEVVLVLTEWLQLAQCEDGFVIRDSPTYRSASLAYIILLLSFAIFAFQQVVFAWSGLRYGREYLVFV